MVILFDNANVLLIYYRIENQAYRRLNPYIFN